MATTRTTPAHSFTADFENSPYRVAYDRREGEYVVVEVESGAELGIFDGSPAGYQDAYRAAAAANYDAAEAAIDARAELLDEQVQADEALAEHLLGELNEIEAQRTAALVNGERYAGEADSLDAAYDRKRQQLAGLGFEVTAAAGGPLTLVSPEALGPRCPRCKQLFDKFGRCGCDYEPNTNAWLADAWNAH